MGKENRFMENISYRECFGIPGVVYSSTIFVKQYLSYIVVSLSKDFYNVKMNRGLHFVK